MRHPRWAHDTNMPASMQTVIASSYWDQPYRFNGADHHQIHIKSIVTNETLTSTVSRPIVRRRHLTNFLVCKALGTKRLIGVGPLIPKRTLEFKIIAFEPEAFFQGAVLIFQFGGLPFQSHESIVDLHEPSLCIRIRGALSKIKDCSASGRYSIKETEGSDWVTHVGEGTPR